MNAHVQSISQKLAVTALPDDVIVTFIPFASLTIGPDTYEISADEAMDNIAFGDPKTGQRVQLRRKVKDGWTKVGSEIIMRTQDAMQQYIKMHVLKMKGDTLADGPLSYNLFDMTWIVRVNAEENGVEMKFPEEPWVNVVVDFAKFKHDCTSIVLHALVEAKPDLYEMLFDDIDQWGQRMSASVQVFRIM